MTNPNDILIALDDGHGMQTPGKRTPKFADGTFMHENEFNRRVVALLSNYLKAVGFKTLLVAPTDADTPLATRVNTANKAKADLYISIHANANTGQWGSWGGIETYTWKNGVSKTLGTIIHKNLMEGTKLRDRGVKDGSHLYVIRETHMPAVLVEAGFMDNQTEAKLLMSESYRQECAREIAQAICDFYKVKFDIAPSKTVTAPASATKTSTAKKSASTMFRVVTGSFTDYDNATEAVVKLKKAKFDSFIDIYKKDGKTFYRVITGSFANKANAENRVTALKKAGFDSFITTA